MNKNASWHIVLIGLLAVIFLGVMFLSTSQVGVERSVEFVDTVELSQDFTENTQFTIGTLRITNEGPLTKRVDVPQYVVCHFRTEREPLGFDVNLQGVRTTSGDSAEPFGNTYYYQQYIDVSSEEAIAGDYVVSARYPYLRPTEQDTIYDTTKPYVHVFELAEGEYPYDACLSKSEEQAIKVIEVQVS